MKMVEKYLWLGGLLLLALYFGGQAWGESERQRGIADFAESKRLALADSASVWTPQSPRIVQGAATLPAEPKPWIATSAPVTLPPMAAGHSAIAVLRIPRLSLEVPVGVGTDESVLLRGAGWIEGTAKPGSFGNVAIAAHRDSFFRSLKDIAVGDLIELETLDGTAGYSVAALSIVAPTDVGVLAQTDSAALTLVTCYPFYFVGHAPQRFIVRAVATDFYSQLHRR